MIKVIDLRRPFNLDDLRNLDFVSITMNETIGILMRLVLIRNDIRVISRVKSRYLRV
jgi:hypothetical protein